jgi:hypothetical protein
MLRRLFRLLWPFNRKKRMDPLEGLKHFSEPHKIPKKLIAGMIIGGAIAGVVGKKIIDSQKEKNDD